MSKKTFICRFKKSQNCKQENPEKGDFVKTWVLSKKFRGWYVARVMSKDLIRIDTARWFREITNDKFVAIVD